MGGTIIMTLNGRTALGILLTFDSGNIEWSIDQNGDGDGDGDV